MNEIFPSAAEAANPDLKPENMMNYELSVEQAVGSKLAVGVSLFYIDGKDMIQTVMVDGRRKNTNTGAFVNKGI